MADEGTSARWTPGEIEDGPKVILEL